MQQEKKHLFKGGLAGFALALLLALLFILLLAYTGAYDISASKDHSPFVRWAFSTTMRNSVSVRASDIEVPSRFTPEQVAAGARQYKSMCEHCHAGPGVQKQEWAKGMLPQPPHLVEAVTEWEPNEVFWLAKHGVRMSAMPAFGGTHEDTALWEITSFVMRLPGMTAEEYAALGAEPAESSK